MEQQGKDALAKNEKLYKIRHSLAHIMAQAVQDLFPGTRLGFGPPISDGFYYDFVFESPINEDDFKRIEKRMKEIIKTNAEFVEENVPVEEAYKKIEAMGEPYKAEYARELVKKQNLSTLRFYRDGDFVDMCEGPHVEKSREIAPNCFKLKSLAGAYWRGDSNNQMMTRIYAWAFETKEELKTYVAAWEEAQKRDHKKLGKELDLFHIDDSIGKGLPLWLPNGAVLREEIEKLLKELEFQDDFHRVSTPVLTKTELYYETGHLPYYAESMYPPMEKKDENGEVVESYMLRPMNCPHHHKVFDARPKSYRDLPYRIAEYGNVFRYEDSGAVSGLLRVRAMCMNDAHIYCTEEQIQDEFLKVMKMHEKLYSILGIKNYYMRFSTWDPEDPKGKEKYVNDPEAWEKSQALVQKAMDASGLPYKEGKGEASFYGPKIDFQFTSVTGREETASTNQLDFAVPARLGLKYIDADNEEKVPYCIHRAPGGTHERFIAFLIEHFGGAFPTWLAPVQVKIIPVADTFFAYAEKLQADLRSHSVRAEVDLSTDSLNKKIRTHTKRKVPNILIVGEKEESSQSVTLRRYGIAEQVAQSYSDFKAWTLEQIKSRALS